MFLIGVKRCLKSISTAIYAICIEYLCSAHFLESNIMKYYYLLTVACIALFFCSCQKGELNNQLPDNSGNNAAGASASRKAFAQTKSVQYGALIDAPRIIGSLDFQVEVADQLGISCLRSRV